MKFMFSLPAAAVLIASSLTAGPASITLVHGIPDLNVSVSIMGTGCKLRDFRFGQVARPIPVLAGTYRVTIHPGADCTAAGVEGFTNIPVTAADDQNLTAVAHLNAAGSPTLSAFLNPSGSAGGRARVVVHHTAAAPAVDVTLTRTDAIRNSTAVDFENQAGGATPVMFEVKPGSYMISVYVAGTANVAIGPVPVDLQADKLYLVYAIGSVSAGNLRPALAVFDLPVRR